MPTQAPGDSPLTARLQAAAAVLLADQLTSADITACDAGTLLDHLVRRVGDTLSAEQAWLLFTAVSTAYPTADQLRAMLRTCELEAPHDAAIWLLTNCLRVAFGRGTPERGIHIVDSGVVVEVDFSARHDVHTGIQRVVRSTVPIWAREHDLTVTAWTDGQVAMRTLTATEQARVLRWSRLRAEPAGRRHPTGLDTADWGLVVPWRSVVVVPEVPALGVCARLAALAESSGNAVVAIGYDCIPVVSADLVPAVEPERFVQYLAAVKHMKRVAGISVSATAEFTGFSSMLATQGLPGPEVIECALPAMAPSALVPAPPAGRPSILCVGSFEPRKNQLAVLYAAETLWREGLDFAVQFVGGGGLGRRFGATVHRLRGRGRPISLATAVTDAQLDALYGAARFTIFSSTHEGYGLPVAESFAHGVPVIASNYGSIREIAQPGGAELIDPRDDEALVGAMRHLLTDDDALAELRRQIAKRPSRSWDDYAEDLWSRLVGPQLGPGS